MKPPSYQRPLTLKDFDEGPIPFVEERLLGAKGKGTMLDMGCGEGVAMKRFSSAGWEAFGLDPSPQGLMLAKNYGQCLLAVGEALPFRDGVFDAVISSNVLHHAEDPEQTLCEIEACLREDGNLLIAEALEDNPILRILRRIQPSFEGVPVRQRLTKQQILSMINHANFTVLAEKSEFIFTWALIELARKFRKHEKWLLELFRKSRVIEERVEKRLEKYSKAYYLAVSKSSLRVKKCRVKKISL